MSPLASHVCYTNRIWFCQHIKPAPATGQLSDREDLDMVTQRYSARRRSQEQILEANLSAYQGTRSSRDVHTKFVQMLLGEAYRYRLSRLIRRQRGDAGMDHFQRPSRRQLKLDHLWNICSQKMSVDTDEDGDDPYPGVLHLLSGLALWDHMPSAI